MHVFIASMRFGSRLSFKPYDICAHVARLLASYRDFTRSWLRSPQSYAQGSPLGSELVSVTLKDNWIEETGLLRPEPAAPGQVAQRIALVRPANQDRDPRDELWQFATQ